jgi:fermentation-respiration switch protein FrsA (DUF1100 family)
MKQKVTIGLVVGSVLFSLLVFYTFNEMTSKRVSDEQRYNMLASLLKEEVKINSHDNLQLHGFYIPYFRSQDETVKTIILVHGYSVSSAYMLHYLRTFLEHGWDILLIDQRGHGQSEGKYASYGFHEKFDLDRWVSWVQQRNGRDSIIGLLGVSMGAGTVLEYAAINQDAKFIIADCPYSDLNELIKYQIWQRAHLPSFPLINAVNVMLSQKVGFTLQDVSPINAIKDQEIPIMFIHGSEDTFVPTYMSEDLYKAKKGKKKLLIVGGAGHGNSYMKNDLLYEKEMWLFIDEVLAAD